MIDTLIVEDDFMLNQIMVLQLSMAGIPVRSAKSGYEALRMIGEQIPNLLILDIGLPDLNGRDLVNMLRTQTATSSIPLIVHTSLDLSLDEQELLKLGPTRCVTKATAFSDHLVTLVHELLDESAISP